MDGVADLPVPTFVIALTNRRELVDNAILRPGRLEVHVGVGKPDEKGRKEILRIHAEKMRSSGRLALAGAASGGAEECVLEVRHGTPPSHLTGPQLTRSMMTWQVVDDDTYDTWLGQLASQTSGFSGAAMAALVRSAVARSLDRSVESFDTDGCRVTENDFELAIDDLRSSSLELELSDESAEEGMGESESEALKEGSAS